MLKKKAATSKPSVAKSDAPASDALSTLSISDIRSARDRDTLNSLMLEYRAYEDEIALNEALKRQLKKDKIEPLLTKLKVQRAIRGEGWHAIRVQGSKSTIVAERLLEHGVDIEVIEQSTEVKTWETWQVRGVKERNGGD